MIRGADIATAHLQLSCEWGFSPSSARLTARVSTRELTGLSTRGARRSSGSLSCASL